jgi:hypothetical protein
MIECPLEGQSEEMGWSLLGGDVPPSVQLTRWMKKQMEKMRFPNRNGGIILWDLAKSKE